MGCHGRAFALWKKIVFPLGSDRYKGTAEMRFNKQRQTVSREYLNGIVVRLLLLNCNDLTDG